MISLINDLQEKKNSLEEFGNLAIRILEYLPNVLSEEIKEKSGYNVHYSQIAGTTKFLRPLNKELFIYSSNEFRDKLIDFKEVVNKLKTGNTNLEENDRHLIDRVLYTIQQSIGAGFDLLANQNSARKHVGNRFEELIKAFFTEIGIANKKTVLQIPYQTEEGEKTYKCENDLILSPFPKVRSTGRHLDEKEIVVSVKTTSKDRMGKMFIDKILLEKFVQHDQKVIGVFLNDVQLK
jgi:hypothetical protein